MIESVDVLVIGSGVAGLTLALEAADHGTVLVVAKRALDEGATKYAQGGIAAALAADDTPSAHAKDTIEAGAGLCHDAAVEVTVREGPARIADLIGRGATFDRVEGELSLTREGGHSSRRVVHAVDATGREVQRALVERARAHKNIRMLEAHMAVDLIMLSRYGRPERCAGAYILEHAGADGSARPVVSTVLAHATVVATGGAGKVYIYTTNPDVSTGDGLAMAYRAGAEISNMEFYQFHPTCLFHPKAKNLLMTEALRGEGAILRTPDGHAFMGKYDARTDLAPRDIVARAIDYEMKRTGSECVHLDMTHKPADFIRSHFPNVHAACMAFGIDMTQEPIPVVPAAHYMCGGITTNLEGRTNIPGLWAVGEVAFTGLHGANRLASNSLLEGLVFGHRAASAIAEELSSLRTGERPTIAPWQAGDAVTSDEQVVVTNNWDELRRTMWNYVGIVRSDARLRAAARRIAMIQEEVRDYYWKYFVTRDLLELRNIATVAELIVQSAAFRRESRGLHYTIDHPDSSPEWAADSVLKRGVLPHKRLS